MMFHVTSKTTTDVSVVGVEDNATLRTTGKVAGVTDKAGLVAKGEVDSAAITATTNAVVDVEPAGQVVLGPIDSSVSPPQSGRIWMRSLTRICQTPAGF